MSFKREKHIIDASKRSMGRIATEVATFLMGKRKVDYKPHEDMGDFVLIQNIENMVLTGKKKDKKIYYHHSGYPGGLKEVSYKRLIKKDRTAALRKAVYGMLPKNKLRKERIKRLSIE